MSFAVLTFEIKFVCFKIYHRSRTPYFIKLLSAYRITLESIFYLKKIKIFHYSLKKRRPRIETAFSDHQCVGGDGDSSYLASAETHKRTGAIHKTDFPTWKVKNAVKLSYLTALANASYCVCCFKAPLQQPATKQTLLFFLIRIPEALFHFPAKGMQAWLGRKALHSLANLCFIVGGVKG